MIWLIKVMLSGEIRYWENVQRNVESVSFWSREKGKILA